MGKKNKHQDYNLRDYIWEEEEFTFQPKVNRHKKFLHAKKRQLEKEKNADKKKEFTDPIIWDEYGRMMSKREDAEKCIAYEDYDLEDDNNFVRYRVK